MNLVDTHAHLYWDFFKEDFQEVIKRSIDANVKTIINVGVDIEASKNALIQSQNELSGTSGLTAYSTIGIHPHEAIKYLTSESIQNAMDELEKIYLSDTSKVVAIGECGLDYFFNNNPIPSSVSTEKQKELQINLFQAQINLAKKLSLPLIVHCRDDRSTNLENSECWDKTLQMIGSQTTILHCYSGLLKTTNYVLTKNNLYISFAGTLTYPKNNYLRETAKILPLEKILLETDCPFLPPQNKRGQRNEPSNILEIAQLLADLKGETIEKVAKITTNNVFRLFALKT